ncbi:MAG: hypothetical protein MJE66_25230 [Proteobacteria bacterium]|nr:hypothetical protein [Pseudomonadota bacterium]
MTVQPRTSSWVRATWIVVAALSLSAATATADDCPTFFPDLRCDSREARPAASAQPMSMPYLFEDPYITTSLQMVGIYHDFPNDSVFRGGDVGVFALQARIAITDRLAFIATKDGLTIFRPNTKVKDIPMATRVALGVDDPALDDVSVLEDEEDFMDIAVGFKYALVDRRDDDSRLIFTPHVRFEIDVGEHDLFQGQGDGVFLIGASAGYHQANWNLLGSFLGQVPIDGDEDSSSIVTNFHVDHAFPVQHDWLQHIVPFTEVNWMHWTNSGDGSAAVNTALGRIPLSVAQDVLGTGRFEGADVANLGSAGIKGADLVTVAWGFRLLLDRGLSLGASYERAVSKRKDIFDQRATVMATVEF